MRTHKEALYLRKAGDKFRPLTIHRPTLRQVGAKLRVTCRRIKNVEKKLKVGEPEPAFVALLRRHRDGLKAYLANIGKERQEPVKETLALRLGRAIKNLVSPVAA